WRQRGSARIRSVDRRLVHTDDFRNADRLACGAERRFLPADHVRRVRVSLTMHSQSRASYVFFSSRRRHTRLQGDWSSDVCSYDLQRIENTRLFVYFGAANYLADVYLNGEKLGRHEGGFTPFNFEITNLVRDAGNFLIVKVDNKRRRDAVPTLITDWWNYGGLTRQVKLVETPATFVQDYFIQL